MDDTTTQHSDGGDAGSGDSGRHEHTLDRGERFRAAAIAAELETGEREPTRRGAWRQSIFRMVRMGIGLGVVVLGIIMMPLPGPGMLVVALGLAILARDVAWADRLLRKVRERLPSDAHGRLSRSTIITMVVLAAAGIAVSIAFAVGDVNPIDYVLFWRN